MDEFGHILIILGAVTVWLVFEDGLAVAGRLGEFDVPSDKRRQNFRFRPGVVGASRIVEELFDVGLDFVRQRRPAVEHTQENPFDLEVRIDSLIDQLDGLKQLSESL